MRSLRDRWAPLFVAGTLAMSWALSGCSRFWRPSGLGRSGPVVVAHRGAAAYAPENTLSAYREAWEREALIAECDVHLSADGTLVVMHDPTVDRTTEGSGAIADASWSEIRQLEAGRWFDPRFAGEPVPSLEQLLDFVSGRMALFIEIKSGPDAVDVLERLMSVRRRQRREVAVISFSPEVIARSEELMPDIPTMIMHWVAPGRRRPAGLIEAADELEAEMIGLPPHAVDEAFVREAHRRRIGVFVFTVNRPPVILNMIEIGVDGIHTDAPDFVRDVIETAPL